MNLEGKPNLAKAVIEVMKAVNGVEKGMTVGSGNSAYKGVSDKDVKTIYKKAMADNGLCILPTNIDDETFIERWEEADPYKAGVMKMKQSIFTKVKTKYLLLHTSGESIEIAGYGHGVDSQDKGAGKATTYAMKYALLYTFMTPTGDLDDSDTTHSNDVGVPKKEVKTTTVPPIPTSTKELPWLNKTDPKYAKAVEALKNKTTTVDAIKLKYKLSKEVEKELSSVV